MLKLFGVLVASLIVVVGGSFLVSWNTTLLHNYLIPSVPQTGFLGGFSVVLTFTTLGLLVRGLLKGAND